MTQPMTLIDAYHRAQVAYHDAIEAIRQSMRDKVITPFVAGMRYDCLRREYGQAGRPDRQYAVCQAMIQTCEDDYWQPRRY